jgi:hypothetical protein
MDKGILPPELKSIEQLFTPDAVFSVPLYQRSFAWGPDETTELWEDVLSAMDRGAEYFLGTVVLQTVGPASYEIIDGQQRLACLSMLFAAVRALFKSAGDPRDERIFISFLGARDFSKDAQPRPKLVLNRTNNETFVQYVVQTEPIEVVTEALKSKGLHESNRLLLEAYRFFLDRVAGAASAKGSDSEPFVVSLIDTVRSSVKFITIPVAGAEDAHLFFESLNARGKELAISDLVKNRLYFEAGGQILRAQALWEQMENQLANRPIPEYLRHYWIAKKAEESSLNVREKHLYRTIADHVKDKEAATLKLLTDIANSARDYAAISDLRLWPDDPSYGDEFEGTLNEMRLFRVTQCNPLLLNAIQVFTSPKAIARVFRIVANFSFRYFIVGNQSPGNLERESAKIALGIRSGSISKPADVAAAFLGINPDNVFRADFSLASFPPSRARMARYLLAKVSNHMSATASATGAELVTNPNAKSVTLEHVLPQSLPPAWTSQFPKGVSPSDYVHRIGNLTLLLKKPNSDAADKSFGDKRKSALDGSSLPINKMFSKASKWTNVEIEKRQDELAKVALEVWKLD